MCEPFAFLAYEPDGHGLTCAVVVIVEGEVALLFDARTDLLSWRGSRRPR